MADALTTLLRLRHLAADQAKRNLAAALLAEGLAEQTAACAASAIRTETATAPRDAGHALAGAYAVWLPAARAALEGARLAAMQANGEVNTCRAVLAQNRADERAVERIRQVKQETKARQLTRQQQITLDEASGSKSSSVLSCKKDHPA